MPPKQEATQAADARINPLDGLRAVAICMVIASHGLEASSPKNTGMSMRLEDALGLAGVGLFFVLSGYLITSLLLKEHAKTGKIDYLRFLQRRAFRIFPAYYAFLIAIGIISLIHVGVHVGLQEWIMDVMYVRNYYLDHGALQNGYWTGHAWSLAVEQQFYLLWPLVLMFLGALGGLRFAVACMIIDPFVRLGTYALFPRQRDLIETMFQTRLDILLYGCVLAIILAKAQNIASDIVRKYGAAILSAAIFFFIAGIPLDAFLRGAYALTVEWSIMGAAVAAIIAYLLVNPSSAVAHALSFPPLTWLGRISYSLYLWQQLFFNPFNHTLFGKFPFNACAALIIAAASYYGIEKPFLALQKRTANISGR